jgi:hypothetical protein
MSDSTAPTTPRERAESFVMETAKPVIIQYDDDVAPDELHPSGVPAGFRAIVPTPEAAKRVHPKARIAGYEDGTDYSDARASREIRERDRLAAELAAPAAPKPPKKSTGGRTTGTDRAARQKALESPEPNPAAVERSKVKLMDRVEQAASERATAALPTSERFAAESAAIVNEPAPAE